MDNPTHVAPHTLHAAGFTLIELMIALGIMGVLMALAAPSWRDTILTMRMTAQANDLLTDISVARAEAVKRNLRTFLCTSSNLTSCTGSTWSQGWIVVVDTNSDGSPNAGESAVLKASPALATGNTLSVVGDYGGPGGSRYIPYRPSGTSTPGVIINFDLCDMRRTGTVGAAAAANKGRRIEINQTGRPVVLRRTCP